ncbi:hypothetical protein V5O48_015288 [Marasmius crinis-equi]|uniref:DUF6535 domain-containing protein n=1 Tax=Marasmius crinis-equi TaxID=585013 RepID=A0ABR3EUX3_9AGAR
MQLDAQNPLGDSYLNSSRTNTVTQANTDSNPDSNTGPPENYKAAEQTPLRNHSRAEIDTVKTYLAPSGPESPVNIDNSSETQSENGSQKELDAEESWDVVMKQVEKYDEEMTGSWVEDINTLLVFAGLLSAVVTAFTIESYRWLREDPADVTVALLTQISQQLTPQNSTSPTTQRQSFQPASSSIRINCFWFLSLILSLATSLFALLCKQWLHENQREAPTQKPEYSLALRQMRYDSLEKGKVTMIVGMLPVLVEFSLLFFFAGLLDLFWSLNIVPLIIVGCVLIGASVLLYFITTIIPGLTLARIFHRVFWSLLFDDSEHSQTYWSTWPYKSPQAWAFFRFIIPITSWPFSGTGKARVLQRMIQSLRAWSTSWPDIDSGLIELWQPAREDIDIHLWEGVKFTLRRFDHVPSLQPHLRTILGSIPPGIALPMGLPQYYRAYTWIESDSLTIDSFFPYTWENELSIELGIPSLSFREPPPDREFILRVITNHLKLDAWPERFDEFMEESRRISQENMPKRTRINFTPFFHIAERLWKENRGVELLDIYRNEWDTYSNFLARNPENILMNGDERYQLIASFARYINTHLDPAPSPPPPPPVVLTEEGLQTPPPPDVLLTKEGLDFLNFVHNQIVQHKLYDMVRYDRIVIFGVDPTSQIIANWVKAMEVVRQRIESREDYHFVEFPPSEAPANPDTQDPKATFGKFGELRNGIVTFIRNALTPRAGKTSNSPA